MIKLICQCCGVVREFEDDESAHEVGWDAPPYFTYYVSCDLCPGVCLVLGAKHDKAHEHWAKHGRPVEFNHFCLPDQDFGKQDVFNNAIEEGAKIVKEMGYNEDEIPSW